MALPCTRAAGCYVRASPLLPAKEDTFSGLGDTRKDENTMIIAVDFDGVLCEDNFPAIGKPYYKMISLVRELADRGHELVLWTCRCGQELTDAVRWCEDRGLHFVTINDNAPSNKKQFEGMYECEPRKIYADWYIDDHNVSCHDSFILRCLEVVGTTDVVRAALSYGVRQLLDEEEEKETGEIQA